MSNHRTIEWLREVQKTHRLTQREMAKHAGISEDKMSRVLHGVRRLDAEELMRFCEALGISLSERQVRRFLYTSFNLAKEKK